MNKITINVKPQNLQKVLTILEAMKPELIDSIESNQAVRNKHIKPVKSSLDKIESKANSKDTGNKYMSKNAYKARMNNKVEEDEFLATSSGPGKYLSAGAYKSKLKKKDQ